MKHLAVMSRPTMKHRVSDKFLADLNVTREEIDSTRMALRDNLSFAEFLASCDQSERVVRMFWHVVLVSALSETLENISFQQGAKVFIDGFLKNRTGWDVYIPTTPLEDLYGTSLAQWLAERDGSIRLSTGVEKLTLNDDGLIQAARLRDGSDVTGDQFILAVPWHRVRDLLPGELQLKYQSLPEIRAAPISSVHLWLDREITALPHAVFVDHLSQWMFNRTYLARSGFERQKSRLPGFGAQRSSQDPSTSAGSLRSTPATQTGSETAARHYYQIVISASRNLQELSQEQIVAQVLQDLRQAFPGANGASVSHSRVVTEHKAVFSPRPGVEVLRPSQTTPVDNLHLAGDWTDTGWPATMEGAVRSGYLAAESVLDALGDPDSILQPDLPAEWLSRKMYGFA
jgi:predicted NAD/FAD-dependent oxidoreductase